MRAVSVYLAGAIAGCDDATAKGWRTTATTAFEKVGIAVRDPIARADYRNVPQWTRSLVEEVVDGDMKDIRESDLVLVRAVSPSWGTAMEIRFAAELGRPVVAFGVGLHGASVSPWVLYHCRCFAKFDDAIAEIGTLALDLTKQGQRAPLVVAPRAPYLPEVPIAGEQIDQSRFWVCDACKNQNHWYIPRRHNCTACGASRYRNQKPGERGQPIPSQVRRAVVSMEDYGKGMLKHDISLGRKRT